jgi:hypothetical protein
VNHVSSESVVPLSLLGATQFHQLALVVAVLLDVPELQPGRCDVLGADGFVLAAGLCHGLLGLLVALAVLVALVAAAGVLLASAGFLWATATHGC